MTLEVLTHTKRRDFNNCRRYFLHKHVQHLALRAQKRGRRRGTIFGTIIDEAQKAQAEGLLENWPELFGSSLRGFINDRAESHFEPLFENLPSEEHAELEVEQVKLRVMVEAYIQNYGLDPRREIEFVLPLRNPATRRTSRAFELGGKIDGAVPMGNKHVKIIEDKLVQSIQQVMILRLPLDAQISEYTDAFLAKGFTVEILYRHTKWPGIEPKKEKIPPTHTPSGALSKAKYVPPETLEEFEERLREDVAERAEFYFNQQDLFLPLDHMEEYRNERWQIAQEILKARARVGKPDELRVFYKNSSRCWEFGGCEYIPLCTKQQGAEALYVVQEDNPELSHGKEGEETVTAEYGGNT